MRNSPWPTKGAKSETSPDCYHKLDISHTESNDTYLYEVGEGHTHYHELVNYFQQLRVGQHAVSQAVIQQVCVVGQHVINVGHLDNK